MGGIPKENMHACVTPWQPFGHLGGYWPHLPRCSTVVAGELGVVSEWFSSHGVTFFFSLSTAGEYDLWSYMLASLWTIGKDWMREHFHFFVISGSPINGHEVMTLSWSGIQKKWCSRSCRTTIDWASNFLLFYFLYEMAQSTLVRQHTEC